MKTIIKSGLAALIVLLAFSCKKEYNAIQYSGSADESTMQPLLTDMNEPAAKAVQIGSQVWMTRNLNVSHYRNGDLIPQVTDPRQWAYSKTGAWCWYNNDSATYAATYGRLYNWFAVNDPRGLAPAGWHVPTDAEWTTLSTYLGGESVAGGKMKSRGTIEAGTGLWYSPNTDATNSSGFAGRPGGQRNHIGDFVSIGYNGNWWSSTKSETNNPWYRSLSLDRGSIYRYYHLKQDGYSVRCIRN